MTHEDLSLAQALADAIRDRLAEQRWSQRHFADQLGVTQGAVSYLLAGKRRASDLDFYERIAQAFGVSLSALIADLEGRRLAAKLRAAEQEILRLREELAYWTR